MNREVFKLLGERFFKKEDISEWAIKCLEKGFDSNNLRKLAAANNFDSPFLTDDYFKRTLKELGWNEINKGICLMEYARSLAQEIIEEKVDPIKASQDIYKIQIELDYPAELIEWQDIDNIIWAYEYFLKTGKKDDYFFRPKEEIIAEIKRLSLELLKSK